MSESAQHQKLVNMIIEYVENIVGQDKKVLFFLMQQMESAFLLSQLKDIDRMSIINMVTYLSLERRRQVVM